MRARMALSYAQIPVEIREISLREKPRSMLSISPKGTVPVLVSKSSQVIDQSLEIMQWALIHSDPQTPLGWWQGRSNDQHAQILKWIEVNDGPFKKILDAYKYPERNLSISVSESFENALHLQLLPMNEALNRHPYLIDDAISLADVALFPFIRQFYSVDPARFEASNLNHLHRWLSHFLQSSLFQDVMSKHPVWTD